MGVTVRKLSQTVSFVIPRRIEFEHDLIRILFGSRTGLAHLGWGTARWPQPRNPSRRLRAGMPKVCRRGSGVRKDAQPRRYNRKRKGEDASGVWPEPGTLVVFFPDSGVSRAGRLESHAGFDWCRLSGNRIPLSRNNPGWVRPVDRDRIRKRQRVLANASRHRNSRRSIGRREWSSGLR